MAPQRLEKIESAPGNGMASEASNPPDLVHRRAADRAQEGQSWCETAKPSAPGKALKTHKCGGNLGPVRIPRRRIVAALAERGGRRAPHFPSADQTGLTRSATASTALAQPRGDREETFPPCNPLKNHKTGTESRSRTGRPVTPSSPRSRRSPASPPAPLPRDASVAENHPSADGALSLRLIFRGRVVPLVNTRCCAHAAKRP
jgi:hypothetical protein